jgi:hypothetical protein
MTAERAQLAYATFLQSSGNEQLEGSPPQIRT